MVSNHASSKGRRCATAVAAAAACTSTPLDVRCHPTAVDNAAMPRVGGVHRVGAVAKRRTSTRVDAAVRLNIGDGCVWCANYSGS